MNKIPLEKEMIIDDEINSNQKTNDSMTKDELKAEVAAFADNFKRIEEEISKSIIGMKDTIEYTLAAIFAGGHVLLEGAPGLGKTSLVKSIASVLGLSFNRIQFTSDLMPSDITGTQLLSENEHGKRQFEFKPGPLFSNIVLADEVNRAGPKTQSALLEAMEEKQVSVLGKTYKLPSPFFVLATQNPIELEGTYPLPEAQLDRFIFKLIVSPPTSSELKDILKLTTGSNSVDLKAIFPEKETSEIILNMRRLVRHVLIAPPLEDALVGTIFALTPESSNCTEKVSEYVRYGPGPRAAQSVLLAAKVFALLDSRINLSFDDIKKAMLPALRHRLILNYQAEADNITTDEIIKEIKDSS